MKSQLDSIQRRWERRKCLRPPPTPSAITLPSWSVLMTPVSSGFSSSPVVAGSYLLCNTSQESTLWSEDTPEAQSTSSNWILLIN